LLKKKSILILGAAGMLGHQLCIKLPNMGCAVSATVRNLNDLPADIATKLENIQIVDVLDETALSNAITSIQPDVIINCIGIVKQLAAADDRYLSVAINAFLPHQLVKIAKTINARLIHISTDCVFTGNKGMYSEDDVSDATDVYGKTKYLGETDDSEVNAITLRTSIIGHEIKNHTHGLLAWFLKNKDQTVKGFQQAFFSGLTTNELVNVIDLVITKYPDLHGVYQIASERISKYDLLQLINEIYQLNITIEPDNSFMCDRSLNMARFHSATGYKAPDWNEMILAMYKEHYGELK